MALAESQDDARRLAHETWPSSALAGELSQVLSLPVHFEAATANVSPDDVAEKILCDQDPGAHLDRLAAYRDAGYDRVTVQQVGLDQERLFDVYGAHVLPQLERLSARPAA